MKVRLFCMIAIFAFMLAIGQSSNANDITLDPTHLPLSWTIEEVIDVPQNQLDQFSAKLGGKLTEAKNYIITAGGIRLQINILHGQTQEDAKNVYKRLLTIRQNPLFCQIQGTSVAEYISENIQIIKKAHDVLDLAAQTLTRWKVQLHLAPLTDVEYMKWNALFNQLANYQRNPNNDETTQEINDLTTHFTFSENLTLRTPNDYRVYSKYDFLQPPVDARSKGDTTTYVFKDLPMILGIPSIKITAEISVKAFSPIKASGNVDTFRLTKATSFWPVDDELITTILDDLVTSDMSSKKKAETILGWLNQNVTYSGAVIGSRYGVQQVLKQGFGHCWDKNDVFITLCRTAGIPARQIAGWLNGVSGHIWSEIYFEDEGWVSVDATSSWLGTSEDYIPFAISEDGSISFVYWDFPVIQKL